MSKVQQSAQFKKGYCPNLQTNGLIRTVLKKDYRQAKKRGKDIAKLDAVLEKIAAGTPLEAQYKKYRLQGEWRGAWECHITPNWLLIWNDKDPECIKFLRTGTHSDIFE